MNSGPTEIRSPAPSKLSSARCGMASATWTIESTGTEWAPGRFGSGTRVHAPEIDEFEIRATSGLGDEVG